MIQAQNLTVCYGSSTVLKDISLHIERGEFVLVAGPSGCGKTTLALALAGLIPCRVKASLSGRVMLDGLDTRSASPHLLPQKAGIVFQNPASQLFHLTVEDEVGFAPRNFGLASSEIRERIRFALDAAGITHLKGRGPRTLSSGEKQRVAIASVLSMKPDLLVLDEPTANLDWSGVDAVMRTLGDLNRDHGMTVVLVEHRLGAVFPHASRILLMDGGGIAADLDPGRVEDERERFESLGLRYPWRALTRGWGRYVPEGIHAKSHKTKPLLSLRGICAGYRGRTVLKDINLSIHPGELVALVGRNGAGKTTLARIASGLHRPKRGKVIWAKPAKRLPRGRRTGLLWGDAALQLLTDSVFDEVSFAQKNFHLPCELTTRAMKATDMEPLSNRVPLSLSVGQMQRTALASFLSADPALLILDEPTIGQDWRHLSMLMAYLRSLSGRGTAVLIITHDDKLVCRFAERVVHLENGKITADGAVKPLQALGRPEAVA